MLFGTGEMMKKHWLVCDENRISSLLSTFDSQLIDITLESEHNNIGAIAGWLLWCGYDQRKRLCIVRGRLR